MEDNNSPKDYYKILEVDYDATEETIKLNYRKLALKWHPDKHNGDTVATSKFQEINEAYNVLMDPALRFEYDLTGIYEIHKYTLREYLARFKGMILTCNGLGISHSSSLWILYKLKKKQSYITFDLKLKRHYCSVSPDFYQELKYSGMPYVSPIRQYNSFCRMLYVIEI